MENNVNQPSGDISAASVNAAEPATPAASSVNGANQEQFAKSREGLMVYSILAIFFCLPCFLVISSQKSKLEKAIKNGDAAGVEKARRNIMMAGLVAIPIGIIAIIIQFSDMGTY